MNSKDAAEYVGERSVPTFLRHVGKIWPKPIKVANVGNRWTREMLDEAIDALDSDLRTVRDVADLL
jgi:hypothetical protein